MEFVTGFFSEWVPEASQGYIVVKTSFGDHRFDFTDGGNMASVLAILQQESAYTDGLVVRSFYGSAEIESFKKTENV